MIYQIYDNYQHHQASSAAVDPPEEGDWWPGEECRKFDQQYRWPLWFCHVVVRPRTMIIMISLLYFHVGIISSISASTAKSVRVALESSTGGEGDHQNSSSSSSFLHLYFHFEHFQIRLQKDRWHFQNGWIFGKVPQGGIKFNPKNCVADFCHYKRFFGHEFRKKSATWFSENEGGGGQRPFGIFPKIHPIW